MFQPPVDPDNLYSLDIHDVPAVSHYITPTYSLSPPLLPSALLQDISMSPDCNGTHPSPPSQHTTASKGENTISPPPLSEYDLNGGDGLPKSLSAAFSRGSSLSPLRLSQEKHGRDKEHLVLFTALRKSGKSVTFIQQGAAFLSHFKKTVPAFLSNHAIIYDNFSLAVWKRMFDAVSPSFVIELPKVGTVSIAYVAILASTVLEKRRTVARSSDETHIMDVIKFSALQRYLDEAVEVDLKAARAETYSFDPIKDYDDLPVLSSIYDE
ncbi:hypothetical protein BD410DRAFT_846342 [Rickenella mellea]|uniref:Uncharacterized protein n=1 Tax=Rickenella mellea TaxID=50990 RepID=A0A4Y7PGZ3_9AGAM|nr:hypothetical protein BD410DRAFT_846342 [Rickenella mellea]